MEDPPSRPKATSAAAARCDGLHQLALAEQRANARAHVRHADLVDSLGEYAVYKRRMEQYGAGAEHAADDPTLNPKP